MSKAAMQQALEALEALHDRFDGSPRLTCADLYDSFYREVVESAISSLHAAQAPVLSDGQIAEGFDAWAKSQTGQFFSPGVCSTSAPFYYRIWNSAVRWSLSTNPKSEPAAYMWQHDETGRTGSVSADFDRAHWEEHNPRLKIVGPLYFAQQPADRDARDAVAAALERALNRIEHLEEARFAFAKAHGNPPELLPADYLDGRKVLAAYRAAMSAASPQQGESS